MNNVKVRVTRIIDRGQPYFVECELEDIHGNIHIFRDKMPIFLKEDAEENELPVTGGIRCSVISHRGETVRIDTSMPDDMESVTGKTIFDVFAAQIKG